MAGWKALVRKAMPARFQVPARYFYDRLGGRLEPEMDLLERIVRPGRKAIDVGANRGVYSCRLWRLGAAVEMFEPNPDCLRVLEAWSQGKPRLRLHPVALSSRAGTATLRIPVDDTGTEHDASASLEHADFARSHDRPVALATLDSFGYSDIDFIKIDVEGHEPSVIEGAGESLRRCRPALLVEIEQRHCAMPIGQVFERIGASGYEGYFLWRGALRPLSTFDPDEHQRSENLGDARSPYVNNFLFLHGARCASGEYDAVLRTGGK